MEPILISIATALATKAATDLYDLVKGRFAKHSDATKALEAATAIEAPTERSPQVVELARVLERVEREDPEFGPLLRAEWSRTEGAIADVDQRGRINNTITGNISGGKVLQAGDIHGEINF